MAEHKSISLSSSLTVAGAANGRPGLLGGRYTPTTMLQSMSKRDKLPSIGDNDHIGTKAAHRTQTVKETEGLFPLPPLRKIVSTSNIVVQRPRSRLSNCLTSEATKQNSLGATQISADDDNQSVDWDSLSIASLHIINRGGSEDSSDGPVWSPKPMRPANPLPPSVNSRQQQHQGDLFVFRNDPAITTRRRESLSLFDVCSTDEPGTSKQKKADNVSGSPLLRKIQMADKAEATLKHYTPRRHVSRRRSSNNGDAELNRHESRAMLMESFTRSGF